MARSNLSELSPEARHHDKGETGHAHNRAAEDLAGESLPRRAFIVIERTAVGVYHDGFTFAGNFAYMSLLAVFSFFIIAAAIIGGFGQTDVGTEFVEAFLVTVPPSVANALHDPIRDAMSARTGPLLWLSAIVGLWTTTSLIETIREILHRAYGVQAQRPFWEYRLSSILLILVSVFVAMLALSAQFVLAGISGFLFSGNPVQCAVALPVQCYPVFRFVRDALSPVSSAHPPAVSAAPISEMAWCRVH